MSAIGFTNELGALHQELSEHNPSAKGEKRTLAARLDPATRAVLERLARDS
jgi:hypothetical protein